MATTDSNNSVFVAIVAIIAVFIVAYFGLLLFNKERPTDTGTTAGIDVNLGNGNGSSPTYSQ